MKTLLTILLITVSINSFGQIEANGDWSKTIKNEFNTIQTQKIDTILVYYEYWGPWTFLPDSCNDIPYVWVLWKKNKKFYYRELFCDSITATNDIKQISGKPFAYFLKHRKDFKLKQEYFKKVKSIPTVTTDGSWEYLIFMTKNEHISLELSEYQRTDKRWSALRWVKATIGAVDITKSELNIK